MQLELNEAEAKALTALIDFAVKAQGLLVAETAVVLCRKIQSAVLMESPPEN